MRDEIVRAITADGLVKAAAITGRDLVERARNIHTLLPVATAALGRTLMAASLMGDAMKIDGSSLTLQIKGGGPLGTILAVSDEAGNVRGYVQNPHVELMEKAPGKLDVGRAVGETGSLTVIKDLGMKEPYVGTIDLLSGEIADDIAAYFVESEQIPTACALGVLVGTDQSVTSAGGYLIQLLPGAGEDIITTIDRHHAGGPYFVAEFYPAWFDVWGKRHSKRQFEGPAKQLDWMLSHDVSVSMYMFHGGTNFAYTNGANVAPVYEPQPTSYDYDAPLGEYGNATPKYYAFRDVIQKHLPAGQKLPDVPAPNPVTSFAAVTLTECAPLNSAFGRRVKSDRPLTMEDVDQDFGYIHYQTVVPRATKGILAVKELRDYAVVLVNGKQVGSLDRRLRLDRMEVDIPAGATLEILVENVGRVNYGAALLDNHKGITDRVTLNGTELRGWTVTPLPLYRAVVSRLDWRKGDIQGQPAFFRGTFHLDKAADTFLDTRGWGKGAVWVNGRSMGKYWNIGPQQTLYLPGPWLKEGENEIVVFAMENTGQRTIAGLSEPILDELGKDPNAGKRVGRAAQGDPVIEEGDKILSGTMKRADGAQYFPFASTRTLRHLCVEVTSGYDGKHSCLSEVTLIGADGKPLPKDSWTIVYANSEEPVEGDAELICDGDSRTYWHSKWRDNPTPFPHRVIIDLGEIQTVKGIELRQRGATQPACVKDFNIYGRPQFFLYK